MKLHRSSLSIALIFLVALFAVAWPTQTAQGAPLKQSSFDFPGDGQRINGRYIGDFCCTGETATVRTTNGDAVGYIYFYDFSGSYNIGKNRSVAATLSILVSGARDLSDPNARRKKRSIKFRARELVKGTTRSVRAGALRRTVMEGDITN